MLDPKIEQWLLNPPPGSKAAAAKAAGVDLKRLIANLKLTPQQRMEKLQEEMNRLEPLYYFYNIRLTDNEWNY